MYIIFNEYIEKSDAKKSKSKINSWKKQNDDKFEISIKTFKFHQPENWKLFATKKNTEKNFHVDDEEKNSN